LRALAKPIGLLRVRGDAMGIAALHPSYELLPIVIDVTNEVRQAEVRQ
jgi:hypothetical protein